MSRYVKPLADAVFILKLLSNGKMEKKSLTSRQRYICAVYLMYEQKYTHQEIANILGLHRVTVHQYSQRMHRDEAFSLDTLTARMVAISAIQKAEVASARLFRKGEEKDAVELYFKLIDKLQSLGFLPKKPLEIEGKMSFVKLMEIVNSETTEGINDDRRTIEIGPAETQSPPLGPSANGFAQENGSHG